MSGIPIPARLAELDAIRLDSGGHDRFKDGHCVMEVVAYVAGEPHSDRPRCTSPAIAAFLRSWNDALDDADRQMLRFLVPVVIGTATGAADELRRAWMATDWLARTFAPAWLRLAGLGEHAAALEALPELSTDELATAAMGVIEAAGSAARSAARSAAGSAAGSAARSAAWSAAWSAAGSAAGSAAESAAWSAARSAAGSAARSAAWSAAGSAAGSALAPTVEALQASAVELVLRMAAVGRE